MGGFIFPGHVFIVCKALFNVACIKYKYVVVKVLLDGHGKGLSGVNVAFSASVKPPDRPGESRKD